MKKVYTVSIWQYLLSVVVLIALSISTYELGYSKGRLEEQQKWILEYHRQLK